MNPAKRLKPNKAPVMTSLTSSRINVNYRTIMECYLKPLEEDKKEIKLPDSVPVYVGRNRNTQLTDIYLSRDQIVLVAKVQKKVVHIMPIGKSYSGCNGYVLLKGESYVLKAGDRLELLLGSHPYEIVFEERKIMIDEPSTSKEGESSRFYPVFEMLQAPSDSGRQNSIGSWEDYDNGELLIFTPTNIVHNSCIAAFDLDGTLIRTKSGSRFPKDSDDWTFYLSRVPSRIKDLQTRNCKIVIFTNQAGLKKDNQKIADFKKKIETIITCLNVPIQVFVSTGVSIYRKPAPGMWNILSREKNDDIKIDTANSFYVGDAAGREKNWAPKKHKDHSVGDRLFAINLKLKFYTPEEYFLNACKTPYHMPEFDPRQIKIDRLQITFNYQQEVILMVGGPGSGKSHYCRKYLGPKGYVVINRDTLGTWQKCVKLLEESIQRHRNIVIDNTHVDKESRQKYITVTKKYNVPCRCFVMSTSFKHAKHNNRFRELTDKTHVHVPEIILHTYKKQYEPPTLDEGFVEIVNIPFTPMFDDPFDEELYKMFLLES